MYEPKVFHRVPQAIQAMQWTGDNAAELTEWTRGDFQVIPDDDRPYCENSESTASLLGGVNKIWFELATGDWVCSLNGHFFWIDRERFSREYQAVSK